MQDSHKAAGLLMAGLLLIAAGARAEVGYAMRGDTRPFHQWDSRFNDTPSVEDTEGIIWRADKLAVRPTLGAWMGWDDNVFLDPEDGEDDTYWVLAPGVIVLYGQEDHNFIAANYEYEDVNYTDFSSEDYESHLFSLGLQLKARSYTTHLSEQFSDSSDADVESGERVRRTESYTAGRVDRPISQRTGLAAHGTYDFVEYDDDAFLDYNEWSAGGDVRHQTWPNTHLLAGVDYGRVDLNDTDVGDADYVEGSVGLRGEPVNRTTTEARVGFQHREFDDPGIEEIDEWTMLLGVSREFWRDSVAGVNVSRSLLPSSQAEGVTRVPTAITGYVQHEILRDLLAAGLSGSYETSDYYDAAGETSRTDERYYITLVLDWQALDLLTLGAGYTYEELDSDVDDTSYTRNLAFIRALGNY